MTIRPDYVYLMQFSGPAPVRVLVTSVDEQNVTYHTATPQGFMLRQPGKVTRIEAFKRKAIKIEGHVLPLDLVF